MKIYLDDIPLPEAKNKFESSLKSANFLGLLGLESHKLDENVVGRVLAEPVWALISSPHYHAAAMDGFAVMAESTSGATETSPIILPCSKYKENLRSLYVDTGDPLPDWANAVIPIEYVEALDEVDNPSSNPRQPEKIRIRSSISPWSSVRTMGEDMITSEFVLPAGHILRPVDLGAIAACGHDQVWVARRPRVAIIPTGSELVPIGSPALRGNILEFNSIVLAAQVKQWGGIVNRDEIVPDQMEVIELKVSQAAQNNDLILLIAGTSAGSDDLSAKIVEKLGEILVHGIAVRPGHPVILGMINTEREGKPTQVPIIGIPGYPVSAAITGELFVEPLIATWLGKQPSKKDRLTASIIHKITSPPGDDDYLRVVVGRVDNKMIAAPLSRGSGVISSLVKADGIVVIPRGIQGLEAGEEVNVDLYRSKVEIENTIFVAGSHDLTLDLLASHLAHRDRRLISSNIGSLAGLMTLKRKEAHLAGSHLLDPQTGAYNINFVHKHLSGEKVVILGFVNRSQGLIVQRSNPKKIGSLVDIGRSDIRYVNRQRGSGTRVLFDYHLGLLGISSSSVDGYDLEEYTHLGVAVAVASDRVDCGLGIAAAADALGLDFIPLYEEEYDLIIPYYFYVDSLIQPLLEIINSIAFQNEILKLNGYSVKRIGQMHIINH